MNQNLVVPHLLYCVKCDSITDVNLYGISGLLYVVLHVEERGIGKGKPYRCFHDKPGLLRVYLLSCPFLGAMTKFRKAAISFVMSVPPSAWSSLASSVGSS
jgi:hypothetical protein